MSDELKRLNFKFPVQTMQRLERLKVATTASSITEVIRSAILNYEAIVQSLAEGYKFYICKAGEDKFHQVYFILDVEQKKD